MKLLEGNVRENVQGVGTRNNFLNSLLIVQEINPQLDKWMKAKPTQHRKHSHQ